MEEYFAIVNLDRNGVTPALAAKSIGTFSKEQFTEFLNYVGKKSNPFDKRFVYHVEFATKSQINRCELQTLLEAAAKLYEEKKGNAIRQDLDMCVSIADRLRRSYSDGLLTTPPNVSPVADVAPLHYTAAKMDDVETDGVIPTEIYEDTVELVSKNETRNRNISGEITVKFSPETINGLAAALKQSETLIDPFSEIGKHWVSLDEAVKYFESIGKTGNKNSLADYRTNGASILQNGQKIGGVDTRGDAWKFIDPSKITKGTRYLIPDNTPETIR